MRVRAKVEVVIDTSLLRDALWKAVLDYKEGRAISEDKGAKRANFIESKLILLSKETSQEWKDIILFLLVELLLKSSSIALKSQFLQKLTDYQCEDTSVFAATVNSAVSWSESAIKLFVTQVLEEKNQNQAQVDLIRFGNGRNDSGFDNEYRHFKAGRKSLEGSVFSDVYNPSMFSSAPGSGVELGAVAEKSP